MSSSLEKFADSLEEQLKWVDDYVAGRLSSERSAHLVQAYTKGILKDEAMDRFEQHYYMNDEAFVELELESRVTEVVRENLQELENDPGRQLLQMRHQRRGWSPAALYAAAAVLILYLGFKIWLDSGGLDTVPGNHSIRELAGEAFKASPGFEARIADASRGLLQNNITRIAPRNDAIFGGEIRGIEFAFDTLAYGPVWRVQILNNREEMVARVDQLKDKFRFSGSLEPGLYYWTLENDRDVVDFGKFYVLPESMKIE